MRLAPQEDYLGCLHKARLERPYHNWPSPSLPAHPTIALCATESEAVHLAQAADLKIDALIAVTPQAAAQCYVTGVSYLKLEDFFDVRAFWDADEPMLVLQSRWAERVDAFLWEANPNFRQYGFRPAGQYFFFLKIASDMLFRSAFGLAHLFLSSRPRQVIYFESDGPDIVPTTLFFNDSVYRLVLSACAREYGVVLTPLSPCAITNNIASLRTPSVDGSVRPVVSDLSLKRVLQGILPTRMVQTLRQVKRIGLSDFLSQMGPWRTEIPTIVFKGGYDVGLVMELAQKRGIRGILFSELVNRFQSPHGEFAGLRRSLADLWPQISAHPFFSEPFRWVGVDLFPMAETRLHYWWHTIIPVMWQTLLQARAYFKAHRPQAVMLYSPSEPEDFGILQAARSLGIPTITYQHGGFEGNCEYTTYDMTDLRHADYRLAYGDGIAAYLRERIKRYSEARAQIVTVGSTRLDALRQAPDERANIRRRLRVVPFEHLVLYLPTSYQYNWYMAHGAYWGVPYFELLVQVVETLKEFPRLRFVYKPFPELPPDPIIKVIAAHCPNCQVVTDISVPALLQASDACIIDIPSTGLLEALLTCKPMLVFSDSRFVSLRPEARILLRKRVMLSETPEDYLKQLRIFLGQERFHELEHADQGFLSAYGTHRNDGRSAQRAVDALQEIVRAHELRGMGFKQEVLA